MISFEMPDSIRKTVTLMTTVAENMMRPVSRHFDECEHEIPWDYINFTHEALKAMGGGTLAPSEASNGRPKEAAAANDTAGAEEAAGPSPAKRPSLAYQRLAYSAEVLSWGDAGLYLCTPAGMLGAAAVQATGTPEQKKRFLSRYGGDKPIFDAMAMTETHAGSEMPSATRTTAARDGDQWVLNGEKIFVTAGRKALLDSPGFVVVWATVDPAAGRAGVKPFVVEAGTPGCTVTKQEHKLGIRASDTVSIVFQDCRIPLDNILGSAEVETKSTEGFKGAMATFDASRPLVAASALGIARAALDFLREQLERAGVTIRYGLPRSRMTNLEREIVELEIMLRSSWLLVLKAVWMMDERKPNNLEASMSKVRAGDMVVKITQRAVELLGPLGISREHLLEKWFRDAKINDLYEGTGQINRLIVARRVLDYSRHELS
jgi:acyl-CoA dehydrogenase